MSRTYRHNLNGSQLQRDELQLEVREVGIAFGGVRALEDVSLEVRQGEIHAVIGPNGAGKTSLLNCISGLYRPQQGSIVLHDGAGRPRADAHAAAAGSPASASRARSRTSSCSST